MSLAGECSPLPASGPQSQPLTLPRFYPAPCVASRVMASLSEATVTKQNNTGGRWAKTPAPVPTQSVRDPPKADIQLLRERAVMGPHGWRMLHASDAGVLREPRPAPVRDCKATSRVGIKNMRGRIGPARRLSL